MYMRSCNQYSSYAFQCCRSSDHKCYTHVQVGGSGKNKVPKTEEIQSFEYKSRVEIDGVSEWEEEAQRSATAETDHDTNSK